MICKVYHSKKKVCLNSTQNALHANLQDYSLVAAVYIPESLRNLENFSVLEHVSKLTKSTDRPWWENPEVFVFKDSRSTCFGDIVIDTNHIAWLCTTGGWKPVHVVGGKREAV